MSYLLFHACCTRLHDVKGLDICSCIVMQCKTNFNAYFMFSQSVYKMYADKALSVTCPILFLFKCLQEPCKAIKKNWQHWKCLISCSTTLGPFGMCSHCAHFVPFSCWIIFCHHRITWSLGIGCIWIHAYILSDNTKNYFNVSRRDMERERWCVKIVFFF